MTASSSDSPLRREITLNRTIDAPRELVWKAWTDPVHLSRWWGPKDFTNPVCELDLKVGGDLRIVMRGPNGTDYPMRGTFQDIVPPKRLVLATTALDAAGNPILEGLATLTLEEVDGKTALLLVASATALVPYAALMLEGMHTGWSGSLDKLAGMLAEVPREIITSRRLDAPREVVFKVWTEPSHVARWWGPDGFTTTIHEMSVRPGGIWRYIMHGPNGVDYDNLVEYLEVVRPERLVYWHGGGDDDAATRFHVTVTFAESGSGTRLTMRALFPSIAARGAVVEFGAIEGGQQTLAKLAEYLKEEIHALR